MFVEDYISDLLFRYECVTVPGFGAFLTHPVSAKIDLATHIFYPPKKLLSFNEQIQSNDGLLANYIAEVEQISFEIANKKISNRILILRAYLEKGETLLFNNIGTLNLNNEGKMVFAPSSHLNYLTDAFGLSEFASPAITREVYKEAVERIENTTPITLTPAKRNNKHFYKYAAVALIALSVGGALASNYYANQIEAYNQLAQQEANQKLETKIQQATFTLNPLPPIVLNVSKHEKPVGKYHIVAGAFRVEDNCNNLVSLLKAGGYDARKIGVNKYGLFEVAYSSHETKEEASIALSEIRKIEDPNAWVLVKELE